jgi:hypothetical protein
MELDEIRIMSSSDRCPIRSMLGEFHEQASERTIWVDHRVILGGIALPAGQPVLQAFLSKQAVTAFAAADRRQWA